MRQFGASGNQRLRYETAGNRRVNTDLNWRVFAYLADVDNFICGAGGEHGVVFPVHVQRGGLVKWELLLNFRVRRVPDYRCFIDPCRENIFSVAIPLQCENWARVATQV